MNKASALEQVARTPEAFRNDFPDWLDRNWHVYVAFSEAADNVRRHGWKHYSARTIMEVLRHQSNVREVDGDYKIGNNAIPDCARLYITQNPGTEGFFTLKHTDLRLSA
jgi:hypothetical protein